VTKIVNGRIIVTRPISPEAYEHVTRALLYEEEQRWDEAAAELQRALPFDDEAAEIRAHLAVLFVRAGRLDDAAEQIDRSFRIAPTVEGWLASAHLKQARGDSAGGIEARRRAVALAIADEDVGAAERAYLELAEAQIATLDVTGAFETTRQLVRTTPDSVHARVELASLAWALGKLDDAEDGLRTALDHEPSDVDVRVMLAEVQVAAGKVAAAKTSFREAMDRSDSELVIAEAYVGWLVLRGDRAEAHELADRLTSEGGDGASLEQMSRIERTVKRPDRAKALAERALALGSAPGRVAILIGAALDESGQRAAAVAKYLSVTADAAEYVEARLRAAELLRDDGKTDEAAKIVDQVLATNPDSDSRVKLLITRSLIDEKRGDAARAARRLDDAMTADGGNEDRLVLARAAIEDRRGDWRRALALAQKLLDKDPQNVEALNFCGFVAADHAHDLQRATRQLQAAAALSPGSGTILDSLGWVYFRAGDLTNAGFFLEQSGRLEPGDPEILSHLGDLYAKRLEVARALETYRKALALSPPERLGRELAERIRTLEARNAAGR
jgi:tetratricopeptide (TPR) repeat protein